MKKKDEYKFSRLNNKILELIFMIHYSAARNRCKNRLSDSVEQQRCGNYNECIFYRLHKNYRMNSEIYSNPYCKGLIEKFLPPLATGKFNKYNIRRVIKFLDHYYLYLKNEYLK